MPQRPLHPFSAEPHLQGLSLTCRAERDGRGGLELLYQLRGPLQPILLPAAGTDPQRRDGLWQSTCFEAFLGTPGQPNYWEINLAPNGDWNVYALTGYRTDLRAETRLDHLPFRRSEQLTDPANPLSLQQLEFSLRLDLRRLMDPDQPLELAATVVMDHRRFGCSYWAWKHSGHEPDFHRRESFLPL